MNSFSGMWSDGSLEVSGFFNINVNTNGYNYRSRPDGWVSRVSSLTASSATLFETLMEL